MSRSSLPTKATPLKDGGVHLTSRVWQRIGWITLRSLRPRCSRDSKGQPPRVAVRKYGRCKLLWRNAWRACRGASAALAVWALCAVTRRLVRQLPVLVLEARWATLTLPAAVRIAENVVLLNWRDPSSLPQPVCQAIFSTSLCKTWCTAFGLVDSLMNTYFFLH